MKKTIRKYDAEEFPYGLHDAHITGIRIKEDNHSNIRVKFLFKNGYYVIQEGDGLPIQGSLCFEQADLDFSNICVLKISDNDKIRGKKYSLKKFAEKHNKIDMEIIDTMFAYNKCIFTGQMHTKKQICEFFMEIYYSGNMVYVTEE